MDIQKEIKKQDEEISEIMKGFNGVLFPDEMDKIKAFFNNIRKETAELVCDEMTGKEYKPTMASEFPHGIHGGYKGGFNKRVIEEKEIKEKILKEWK